MISDPEGSHVEALAFARVREDDGEKEQRGSLDLEAGSFGYIFRTFSGLYLIF